MRFLNDIVRIIEYSMRNNIQVINFTDRQNIYNPIIILSVKDKIFNPEYRHNRQVNFGKRVKSEFCIKIAYWNYMETDCLCKLNRSGKLSMITMMSFFSLKVSAISWISATVLHKITLIAYSNYARDRKR